MWQYVQKQVERTIFSCRNGLQQLWLLSFRCTKSFTVELVFCSEHLTTGVLSTPWIKKINFWPRIQGMSGWVGLICCLQNTSASVPSPAPRHAQWTLVGNLGLQAKDKGQKLLVANADPAILIRVMLPECCRQRLKRHPRTVFRNGHTTSSPDWSSAVGCPFRLSMTWFMSNVWRNLTHQFGLLFFQRFWKFHTSWKDNKYRTLAENDQINCDSQH